MKKLLLIVVLASLAANVWLFARWQLRRTASIREATAATLDRSLDSAANRDGRAAHRPDQIPAKDFDGFDLNALRDALRTAGASEPLVRAILDGQLRRRYREQLANAQVKDAKNKWWRSKSEPILADNSRLLKETVFDSLTALLGPDPRNLADAENRYPFLPAEKRRRLAEIDLDYTEMAAPEKPIGNGLLKTETDQGRLLAAEQRKDVLAELSPDERSEYDLRFTGTAGTVSGRFATDLGTPEQYRAIKPLIDDFNQLSNELPRDDNFSARYAELQQRTMDNLVAAAGYEAAVNYVWSGPGLYSSIVQSLQQLSLPPNNAGQILQLADLTARQAESIQRDDTLEADQKRAALLALQETVRPQFNGLVSDELRAKLPPQAVSWFTMLGDGQYMYFHPFLISSMINFPSIAVTAKPPGAPASAIPLPRRSGSQ
jgi:hypothetical protein